MMIPIFVEILSILIPIIIMVVIAAIAVAAVRKSRKTATISSDGHKIPADEDITCRSRGHFHRENPMAKEFGPRYIVHNEPETGYVILNGVKRKLTDCRNL